MRYRLTWAQRLHRKQDFSTVIRTGRRFQDGGLTLWVWRRPDGIAYARLGLAIPRAFGSAVERNRIKRLIRETFRLGQHALAPRWDLVFSARAALAPRTQQAVSERIHRLWKKAGLISNSLSD